MAFHFVQQRTLEGAIAVLRALKMQFKIIGPDGEEYGELVLESPKKSPRKWSVPSGYYSNYVRPLMENMQVGDVVQIPIKDYNAAQLGSSTSSFACRLWGNGSATYCTVDGCIEVLRLK